MRQPVWLHYALRNSIPRASLVGVGHSKPRRRDPESRGNSGSSEASTCGLSPAGSWGRHEASAGLAAALPSPALQCLCLLGQLLKEGKGPGFCRPPPRPEEGKPARIPYLDCDSQLVLPSLTLCPSSFRSASPGHLELQHGV